MIHWKTEYDLSEGLKKKKGNIYGSFLTYDMYRF